MAALNRPTTATYTLHEELTVDTRDHQDHSFCGILFPIEATDEIPISKLIIDSISVRGALGNVSIYVTKSRSELMQDALLMLQDRRRLGCGSSNNNNNNKEEEEEEEEYLQIPNNNVQQQQQQQQQEQEEQNDLDPTLIEPAILQDSSLSVRDRCMNGDIFNIQKWKIIYNHEFEESWARFVDCKLSPPLEVQRGEVLGIYVHSTLPGDEAIVYDNQKTELTYKDNFLSIHPGFAHICNRPFGNSTLWGYGSAWRDRREFVGQIHYGAVYQLWNPNSHLNFGPRFRNLTELLLVCQRRRDNPFCLLPDECIFYIMNMCRWDWAEDTIDLSRHTTSNQQDDDDDTGGRHFDFEGSPHWLRRHLYALARAHPQVFDNPGDELFDNGSEDEEDNDDDDYDDDDDWEPEDPDEDRRGRVRWVFARADDADASAADDHMEE